MNRLTHGLLGMKASILQDIDGIPTVWGHKAPSFRKCYVYRSTRQDLNTAVDVAVDTAADAAADAAADIAVDIAAGVTVGMTTAIHGNVRGLSWQAAAYRGSICGNIDGSPWALPRLSSKKVK